MCNIKYCSYKLKVLVKKSNFVSTDSKKLLLTSLHSGNFGPLALLPEGYTVCWSVKLNSVSEHRVHTWYTIKPEILAVGPKIAIVKILADFYLAVR